MENTSQLTYSYLDKYLIEVRSQGRYAFTLDEIESKFNTSYHNLRQILYRLKKNNKIAQIRQGFYVIVPLEYSKQGIIPPYLYIDDLMKSLNKPYYVGLLSAAAFYGATHQQPTEYTVVTQAPAPQSIDKSKILFFSKKEFLQDGIVLRKAPVGYINVSSPELTALDLFFYIRRFGINRVTTILQVLSEEMKPSLLLKIATQYPNTAAILRLRYILDTVVSSEKLSNALWKVLNERNFFPAPLSPQKAKKGTGHKWKIIQNMEVESDL